MYVYCSVCNIMYIRSRVCMYVYHNVHGDRVALISYIPIVYMQNPKPRATLECEI